MLRGPKGEDLASTNARTEQASMPALAAEEARTVRATIALPLLQPGTYTLSPTLAYAPEGERVVLADQVDNALVFTVTAARKVHAMLALETGFEVEPAAAPLPQRAPTSR